MHSPALAYFITWTTYGTWLHGDERGSVDRGNSSPFTPTVGHASGRVARETRLMKSGALVLSDAMRSAVEQAIREHAAHKGWMVQALNVRTNHVHLVCTTREVTPEQVMRECKAWATRRMRETGLVREASRVWTRHGSTRYIWDERSLAKAVEYVRDWQDDGRRFERNDMEL